MNLVMKLTMAASSVLFLTSYASADIVDHSVRQLTVVKPVSSNYIKQKPQQTSHNTYSTSNQSEGFPEEIEDGYWAMTSSVDGLANTVKFSDHFIHIHQFKCLPDNTFEKLATYSYEMEPQGKGMGLKRQDGSHYSQLNLIKLDPQKSLLMHQDFIANLELKRSLPNGVDLEYLFTPKLLPACPRY